MYQVAELVAALSLLAGGETATTAIGQQAGTLEIPAIGITVPIIEGTLHPQLERGAGHLYKTAWPGDPHGTTILFAHRVTPVLKWNHGPFRYIDRLESGDRIVAVMPYGRVVYRVLGHRIIRAERWKRYRPRSGRERLLIVACHPAGSAAFRYVVVSERVARSEVA